MSIERPYYKGAPITGENLKLMMKAYYSEFDEGPDASYTRTAQELHLLISKDDLYRLYNMDTVESICIKAKPFVLTATLPKTKKSWTRPGLLMAILHNSVTGFPFKTDNDGFKIFAANLGKLMSKSSN